MNDLDELKAAIQLIEHARTYIDDVIKRNTIHDVKKLIRADSHIRDGEGALHALQRDLSQALDKKGLMTS